MVQGHRKGNSTKRQFRLWKQRWNAFRTKSCSSKNLPLMIWRGQAYMNFWMTRRAHLEQNGPSVDVDIFLWLNIDRVRVCCSVSHPQMLRTLSKSDTKLLIKPDCDYFKASLRYIFWVMSLVIHWSLLIVLVCMAVSSVLHKPSFLFSHIPKDCDPANTVFPTHKKLDLVLQNSHLSHEMCEWQDPVGRLVWVPVLPDLYVLSSLSLNPQL